MEPGTGPLCLDERRKAAVRTHPNPLLNGIDFVESAVALPLVWLEVNFLRDVPADLVGHPEAFHVEGGTRIAGIRATGVAAGTGTRQLKVFLDREGDFSTYLLRIEHSDLDSQLAAAPFRFRAGCPSEIDCRQDPECPPEPLDEPALDYLAKDYASFRRLLLDLIPQLNPRWLERNPADVGMALVELLAYRGDHLSYFQDAVATESYLDTCRHRISARRHTRLVDYRMHDGRNAWTFVQLDVPAKIAVPQGTMLLTRISQPLLGRIDPPGAMIELAGLRPDSDPALREVTVFETTAGIAADPLNNELRLHSWGDLHCCLPRGATGAFLWTVDATGTTAVRPPLKAGDYLLFEEVRGPATGLAADADSSHRQVVRLVAVEETEDPVFRDELLDGEPQRMTPPPPAVQRPLPLLRVLWRERDALAFPLCLSAPHPETGEPVQGISLARGNVVPCDHGRTVLEDLPLPGEDAGRSGRLEVRLSRGPLTFQPLPADPVYDDDDLRLIQPRHELAASPREVQPAVVLKLSYPPQEDETWTPVPDLLDSRPQDRHFAVDVDNDGRAVLRFGDDDYGRRPAGVTAIRARYRIGNGLAGNLGSGALVHVVEPDPALGWPKAGIAVRHPLPSVGGADPETLEEVRQLAPRAFHAEPLRAVTEEDYEAAARKLPEVAAAKCTFRWTGSWHTVFVAVHPRNPADLVTEPGGRTRLRKELARRVRAHLTRYKLAGYDLAVRTAQYVPLEIDVRLCIARGHFRGDVLEGVYRALSSRRNPDGSAGFFFPERFSFGQAVHLSRIYAAVERVEGVESAVVTLFKRYWAAANQELENGEIPLGDGEIARLDNDPNFPENGVLRVSAVGGL